MSKSVLVRIEGRVQGVWYRDWTVGEASQRGLSGWVRNRRDGSVEALFSGDEGKVDEMLKACLQGPPAANVTAVLPEFCEAPADAGFLKRSTL